MDAHKEREGRKAATASDMNVTHKYQSPPFSEIEKGEKKAIWGCQSETWDREESKIQDPPLSRANFQMENVQVSSLNCREKMESSVHSDCPSHILLWDSSYDSSPVQWVSTYNVSTTLTASFLCDQPRLSFPPHLHNLPLYQSQLWRRLAWVHKKRGKKR